MSRITGWSYPHPVFSEPYVRVSPHTAQALHNPEVGAANSEVGELGLGGSVSDLLYFVRHFARPLS